MKSMVFAALICLVVPAGFAQQNANSAQGQPASKENVERFLEAMHTREMMQNMIATMAEQMHEMVREQIQKTPNLPHDFEAQQDQRMDDFARNFPVDEMIQAMVPIYQRHFTEREIDDLVAFYSSPTGQKMVKEMPAITAEAMQSSQDIIQRMIAKELQHIQDEIEVLQKQNRAPAAKPQ
jgi:uncharacterized protein